MESKAISLLLLFVTLTISSQSKEFNETKYETLLLDTIFEDYDKRIRPVKDYHTPVVVKIDLSINQITQVNEKHQVITSNILRSFYWEDFFLKWNPEKYGNITQIFTHRSQIWTPDIQIYNSIEFEKEAESNAGSDTKNVISNNGFVVDAIPMVLRSTCKIDVTWFPFDEQKCSLIFGSWTLSSKYLLIQFNEPVVDGNGFIDNGEWELRKVTAISNSSVYSCCPDEPFTRIIFTLHLKRRAFYYFFNLLIPCALIGFLAVLNFTLPPESGEKLPLGATILFSLIVFLNMISESMPANSDAVPLLGTYFNCVMFTIALSVVSTIVINLNLNVVNPKEVKGLFKKMFLCWLPRILRMNCSRNIFDEQHNKEKIGDTITLHLSRSGHMASVFTFSLASDKIATQQWKFIAAVVDRMCLIFSFIFTLLSITVFLIYAF